MNEQELEKIVLGKTDEAYALINSLGDEDGEMLSYFRELSNFYTHPKNREVYLNDFKEFYFGDIERIIFENESRLEIYEWGEKRFKRNYVVDAVCGLGFLGATIFYNPVMAIPIFFVIFNSKRTYSKLKELKEDRKRVLSLLQEKKDMKKEVDEMDPKLLEKVLDNNKDKMMEYHRKAMEDTEEVQTILDRQSKS